MDKLKTFQLKKTRLSENAGTGLNKAVCVAMILILIVLVCAGGFFWYKHSKNKVLTSLEESGDKIEHDKKTGKNEITGGNSSVTELVAKGLQVGDYVSYMPDTEATDYYGDIANWRVWKIEGDNIVIVPTEPLGDLTLEGAEDWLNAEEKIENECDKYINDNLGITAENIRSMKIEDIEEVMPKETIESAKLDCDYGKKYSYESGTFYAEKADADKFDGYNKELSTPKISDSGNPVTVTQTYWSTWDITEPTWNNLENTKEGMNSDTYGTILGNYISWLASRCVYCLSSDAYFYVRLVNSGSVDGTYLYYSVGSTVSISGGVRPLVSLSSKLFTGYGQGISSNPWQLKG